VSRLELLEWAAKRLGDVEAGTNFAELVPQLLSCMNDKDSKVQGRAGAKAQTHALAQLFFC
jgi:hypothetical protein